MQRANDINKGEFEFEFGKPYKGNRKHSKFDNGEDLTVIPVEIELDYCLYTMIQNETLSHFDAGKGMSFEEWVNICFKERMNQILADPKEYGKIVLDQIRINHCLQEVDLQEK